MRDNTFFATINSAWLDGKANISDYSLTNLTTGEILQGFGLEELLTTLENEKATLFIHNLDYFGYFFLSHALENKLDDTDYLIGDNGSFYYLTFKNGKKTLTIRDSKKIIPAKENDIVSEFGESGISLMLAEILDDGNKGYTIGARCLSEFRYANPTFDNRDFNYLFPDLTLEECPIDGFDSVDDYIRKSYHGGWCFVKPNIKEKVVSNGRTYDVNSLYPAQTHSNSGNYYPFGKPVFFTEAERLKHIDDKFPSGAKKGYYFIRFRCEFNLKPNCLPTVQIKDNFFYDPSEWLSTNKVLYNGEYVSEFMDITGTRTKARPVLTMTETDFKLFKEHYNIKDFEFLDGCYFRCTRGLFDWYIDKYMALKETSTGIKRKIAKLYLNNLGGKFGTEPKGFKRNVYLDEKGVMNYTVEEVNNKKALFVPVASAMTSYSRNFTIRHAQENYDIFVYSDTDSLHLLAKKEPVNLEVHSAKLGAWKHESDWTKGKFIKAKVYIEEIDGNYDIKFAGCTPEACNLVRNKLVSGELKLKDINKGFVVDENYKSIIVKGGKLNIKSTYVID